jgi:hypothetical protein
VSSNKVQSASKGTKARLNRIARLKYEKIVFGQSMAGRNREERETDRRSERNNERERGIE